MEKPLRVIRLFLGLVFACLLSGCKGDFTSKAALDAVRTLYKLPQPPLEISLVFRIGDIACRLDPKYIAEMRVAEEQGWVKVEDLGVGGICWTSTLTPLGQQAISPTCKGNVYTCAILATSTDVKIGQRKRDGEHAVAEAEIDYAFTPQMKALASENSFPALNSLANWPNCVYDLPNARIVCKRIMNFALMGGEKWVVDTSNR